jgi:hypothetical protein
MHNRSAAATYRGCCSLEILFHLCIYEVSFFTALHDSESTCEVNKYNIRLNDSSFIPEDHIRFEDI